MLKTLWHWRERLQDRGHDRLVLELDWRSTGDRLEIDDRRVLELESFFDCKSELRGLRGLGCACGFGHDWGRHLISTLSFGFPSCGFLLVQLSLMAIRYLQANVLAALLVEMATTAREDQGEDKSDDDPDDDADDDPD